MTRTQRAVLVALFGFIFGLYIGLSLGCASKLPNNPLKDSDSKKYIWWRQPYTSNTDPDKNEWLKFIPKQPNVYDPWAEDDIQKYSTTKVVGPSRKKDKVDNRRTF